MYFILAVTILFIGLSIYFFFRAEKFQHNLITVKRDNSNTNKENSKLLNSIAFISVQNEEFAKHRLGMIKAQAEKSQNVSVLTYVELITPFIHNYDGVFQECLKSKGQYHANIKKCYENANGASFKEFEQLITQGETHFSRFWVSNDLQGYCSLVEALLLHGHKEKDIKAES